MGERDFFVLKKKEIFGRYIMARAKTNVDLSKTGMGMHGVNEAHWQKERAH